MLTTELLHDAYMAAGGVTASRGKIKCLGGALERNGYCSCLAYDPTYFESTRPGSRRLEAVLPAPPVGIAAA